MKENAFVNFILIQKNCGFNVSAFSWFCRVTMTVECVVIVFDLSRVSSVVILVTEYDVLFLNGSSLTNGLIC